MWTIAKVKNSETNIFKEKLISRFGKNMEFYIPRICCQRYVKNKLIKFERNILENYVFCYHDEFVKPKTLLQIQFISGLQYFLTGHIESQNEIKNFINACKSNENDEGYIKPIFFKELISKKAQFISGPFTNAIFEIISREKNKLKILLGNTITTISDKKFLYRSVG